MSRLKTQHLKLTVLGMLIAAGVMVSASKIWAAEPVNPVYTLRYALVSITPNGLDPVEGGANPEFLEKMQNGSAVELGPTPEAFLENLKKEDQRYSFRLITAGSSLCEEPNTSQKVSSIKTTSAEPRDYKFTITDRVEIVSDDGNLLQLRQQGKTSLQYPDVNVPFNHTWDGTRTGVVPGLTFHGGIYLMPNGARLAYILTVVRGDARFSEKK
jgi:hypothetical protein